MADPAARTRAIVEAMGGRVDFAARDGGGLAATFRAPVES